MIITVSDTHGVKQYNLPNNIKKLIIIFVLFLTSIVIGLSFFIHTLNDKLLRLEQNINTERIVEKFKEDISPLAQSDVSYKLDDSSKKLAYELAIFEDDTLSEEALKEEKLVTETSRLLKLKNEKDALAKIEQEKKAEVQRVLLEKKEQARLVKAEKQREQKLADANVKAEKLEKIRVDKAMLVKAEQKKNDKLVEIEKNPFTVAAFEKILGDFPYDNDFNGDLYPTFRTLKMKINLFFLYRNWTKN